MSLLKSLQNKINTSGTSFYKAYAEIPATGIATGASLLIQEMKQ